MPIISFGIFLPDGRFLPNSGDGHCKNAVRFCEKYASLDKMRKDNNELNADEFLITAGCVIVAGYRGVKCIKAARNNSNPIIKHIIKTYKDEGFEAWLYWEINQVYQEELKTVVKNMSKMELAKKEQKNEIWIYSGRKILS